MVTGTGNAATRKPKVYAMEETKDGVGVLQKLIPNTLFRKVHQYRRRIHDHEMELGGQRRRGAAVVRGGGQWRSGAAAVEGAARRGNGRSTAATGGAASPATRKHTQAVARGQISLYSSPNHLLPYSTQVKGERGRRAGWAWSVSRRVAVVGAHFQRPCSALLGAP